MTDRKIDLARTRRSLPMALLRAREAVMDRFRPMLNARGVTEQQWRVMRVLAEGERIDATALAKAANILPPSLTRILKTLDARGFIEIRRHPDDARRTLITLAAAGQDFMAEVAPASAQIYARIETLIGPEHIDRLLDDLEVLQAALERSDPRGLD